MAMSLIFSMEHLLVVPREAADDFSAAFSLQAAQLY